MSSKKNQKFPKEFNAAVKLMKSFSRLVKYSLTGYTNPIGVANWERQVKGSFPENLKASLPTIEEIEKELDV